MADGLGYTSGSGNTVATDDCGAAGHAQVMKLAVATDGSATPIPADADGLLVNISNASLAIDQATTTGSGNLTGTGQAVTLTLTTEAATVFHLTGTWVGTVTFEASLDNTNWSTIYGMKAGDNVVSTNATANDLYRCTTAGFAYVRARCSAYTSGTIAVQAKAVSTTSGIYYNFPGINLAEGNNVVKVITAGTDAEANSFNRLESCSHLMQYENPTWSRVRGDTISGLWVNVKAALPAGTNAIGKLAANSGVDIGDVDVLSLPALPAGTNSIGLVVPTPSQVRISVTPTISSGSAYASGDQVGGIMEFTNAARVSGGSGIIQSVLVLDKTQAQRAAMDLMFFDRTVTVPGDNAAINISDADMAYCLGVIPIGPYNTTWPGTPLNSFSTLVNVGLPFVLNATSLFVVAVVRAAPTYTSTSDLIFTLGILRD